MKLSGKILLFIFCTSIGLLAQAQPCTPMTNFPANQGILPDVLPAAYLDGNYTAVMQLKAPLDTNVTFNNIPVTFRVDSMRLVQTLGLPPGISFECNPTNCMLLGGQQGCALINGQPTQGGIFPIKLVVRTSGKVQLVIPIPQVSVDTNEQYTIYIHQNTGIFSVIDKNSPLEIYPNPAQTNVTVKTNKLPGSVLSVYDMTGKLMHQESASQLNEELSISTSNWTRGLYQVELTNDLYTKRTKLLLR